jgi:hypothetical protein
MLKRSAVDCGNFRWDQRSAEVLTEKYLHRWGKRLANHAIVTPSSRSKNLAQLESSFKNLLQSWFQETKLYCTSGSFPQWDPLES